MMTVIRSTFKTLSIYKLMSKHTSRYMTISWQTVIRNVICLHFNFEVKLWTKHESSQLFSFDEFIFCESIFNWNFKIEIACHRSLSEHDILLIGNPFLSLAVFDMQIEIESREKFIKMGWNFGKATLRGGIESIFQLNAFPKLISNLILNWMNQRNRRGRY